jgi:hypothetical protein
LSVPQGFRVAEYCGRRARGKLRPQQGQISVGIVSEYLGLSFAGFSERKPHALGATDDVAVGQHQPVSGNDHTGAGAAHPSSAEALDADDRRTDPVDDCSDGSRIGVEWRLVLWVADRVAMRAGYIKHGGTLEIEYAPPRRMGDCFGTTNGIELVEQGADVELGGVNRNAKSARDLFVRGAFRKQRENLELPRGKWNFAITQSRFCCGKH